MIFSKFSLKLLNAGYLVDTEIVERDDKSYEVKLSVQALNGQSQRQFTRVVSDILSKITIGNEVLAGKFPGWIVQPYTLDSVLEDGSVPTESAQVAPQYDRHAHFVALLNSYQRIGQK